MLARKPRMLVTTALANKMARIVWGLLVKGGTYRAPAAAAKARRGHRGVGRAQGGHGATVGETGSGQPGCNTVLRVRHLDLDPLRELPCRPAVDDRARGRTDGSIRLRVTAFLMFSLALKGASTDVAWIGRLASGAGRCRTTAPSLTRGPLPCRSKPRQPVAATLRSSGTG